MFCAYDATRNSDRAADRLIRNNNCVFRLLSAALHVVFGIRREAISRRVPASRSLRRRIIDYHI